MKSAAYQMSVAACYDGHAIDVLRIIVRHCEARGISLLCCPEGALGGLADYVDDPTAIALPSHGDALAMTLAPLASATVTTVVGFTEVDAAGRWYNSAVVYAEGAVRAVYRKRHPAIRRSRYTAGSDAPVVDLGGLTLGILICRDSTDSALVRDSVSQGAQALLIPTNNAMPASRGGPALRTEARVSDWRSATQLAVPVIRADVVGHTRGLVSAGASTITSATGEQIFSAGDSAGELVVTDIELHGSMRSTGFHV